MKKIQQTYIRLQPHVHLAVAVQVLFAIFLTAMPFGKASAVQLTARSIQMSDSGPSGGSITSGVGSGSNVAYKVTFTTTNTATAIAGIVIDFCSNSPLIGDSSCTAPTGFNVNRSSTQVYNQSGLGTGSFTVYTSDATNNRIILTRGTAAAPTGTGSFELGNGTTNGITNPSTLGAFYARIHTYTTAASAQGHNTTAPTGYLDSGGVALTTANVITITARVQENLIFCVFGGAAPNNNCAAATGSTSPALTIGHSTGGALPYIDSSVVDTAQAYTQLSTNAGSGATVRMHSSSSTGGLDNGSNSIPPANSGTSSPGAITAGQAAFGLFVSNGSGGIGTVNADANYRNPSAHNTFPSDVYYGMDSTTTSDNVTTTYGDTIMLSSAPVSNVGNTLYFAATASNVTPAGTYKANLALIATGVF